MVGAALCRTLAHQGYENLVLRSRRDLDLIDPAAVRAFFSKEKVDYVFLAAAKVGGIIANDTQSADFIRENLYIQTNVIDAAYRHGVKKLMFLGSSCIYPKFAEQPVKESSLLTGALEPTNRSYAVAKIAGAEMCDAYRKQFGFNAVTVMPCNVYGIGDNVDPDASHVIAGLMRRLHEAKVSGRHEVIAWGTGRPLREFLFVDDLADACVFLMNNHNSGGVINAGSGDEVSIRALADLIATVVDYQGKIIWDAEKPDGTPRKLMDNSRLAAMGWRAKTTLNDGLARMYQWYCETHGSAVGLSAK